VAVSDRPEAAGEVPPQNLEAETSVLGAVLLNEKALDALLVDVRLRPEDFYRGRHERIFRAMIDLKEKSEPEPIDALTVSEQLERAGELEEAGGRDYVHSLPGMVLMAGNYRHYGRIVKDHSLLRRLLGATREIGDQVFSHTGDPRDLMERAEMLLFRVGQDQLTGDLREIEGVLNDEIDKLERLSREGIHMTGTPSGFTDLDELTGGFQPGNLIVLAARPSMGKSTLVTNMAENAAIDTGQPVALFSLEMSEAELAQRFIASQARVKGDDLRKGRVKSQQWPKVLRGVQKLAAAPLYIDDSSDIGIHELRAKVRRLHARTPLGLVIVDYLQLMRPEDSQANRVEQVGQISRGLKILARELDIPVIGVSQLSRAVESRPDKRPLLSDLRESGQIEQDADLVMFIYREDQYNRESERPNEADIIVAKHRNGPVGERTLTFLPQFPRFGTYKAEPVAGRAGNGGPPDKALDL
jgi:replicative DNA helicase